MDNGLLGAPFLRKTAEVFEQRAAEYGSASAFASAYAARLSVTLGRTVTPIEAVLCLLDLKLTRLAVDPSHKDSITDIAGYAAVLWETVLWEDEKIDLPTPTEPRESTL